MSNPKSPTIDQFDEHDDLNQEFGRRVRMLRDRGELTLEELATRSGVSRAMLSKVERGEKSPTIGLAKRIAHALDTSLSFLMGDEQDQQPFVVVRRDERHVFRDPETGFERHLLSPTMIGNHVELLLHWLPAGASTGMMPAYRGGTEKHIAVAEGELIVSTPKQEIHLGEGDALFFEASVEHAFSNRSRKHCSYYVVISRRDEKLS
ncbi:XRE family transcriptional regulator [Burkholderia cenocepacia]|uniref:helix-turn-helix domain-containing protein n=1 Tax=Burkholderia cenocepacia TaxID=95486 RepID=UPI000F58A532|nr:XRE family transcriptional regulator [Burkholderia cenocepacia]RQU32778.1 XRE family transcriptional regulator [Burkholderia cenocepacia]RQU56991.1 XRE family transcriptional regulator [Burkholderia cenocepacia]